MLTSNDNAFFENEASTIMSADKEFKTTLTENPNDRVDDTSNYLLFNYHVMASNKSKKDYVMVESASVNSQNYSQVNKALDKFDKDDTKTELFISVTLYGKHAVYMHAKKIDEGCMKIEYVDPYGDTSPYGNPPEDLRKEVDKGAKERKSLIEFTASKKCQQGTSNNCFAIVYQNMLDKYEERNISTISELANGKEDESKIIEVRLKMKQDMHWMYNQYNTIKAQAIEFGKKAFPTLAEERTKIINDLRIPHYDDDGTQIFDSYDPEDYGHELLIKAEKSKCVELLSQIDFSQAPSRKLPAIIEFPNEIKDWIEQQGHKISPIHSLSDSKKIIGYSIDLDQSLSMEEKEQAMTAIDNKLPDSLSDKIIYITERQKVEESPMHKESSRPYKL